MEGTNRLYPPIEPYELEPPQVVSAAATGGEEAGVCDWPVMWDEEPEASPSRQEAPHIFETETKDHPPINFEEGSLDVVNAYEFSNAMTMIKETGEDIYSKSPLRKQTGIWVPASVPPMTKHDHDEWKKGFGYNSSCFEEEYNWDIDEENWEMTMWDVLTEIFVAGKDKILSVASYDFERHGLSLVSQFFLEEALKDKSETLEDTCSGPEHALLETEPAKWLPDSAASSCMLCGARFHPIICTRHHCRFCGGIFCGGCSKGRSLLPPKFTFWLFKGSKLAVFVVGYFVAPHIFETETKDHPPINFEEGSLDVVNAYEFSNAMTMIKETGEDIYSKSPLRKQTGIWVPASVPPMTKHDHDEWKKGFGYNSSCFEEEYNWDIDEENWEMTMWDVLTEIFVAGKDKILSVASYDFERHGLSLVSQFFLEEALKDKSETLEDTCSGPEHALLETEPAKWLPDSAASSCMLCGARFHPIICTRHHCRFCGGIFCGGCSKGRSLLPPKFTTSDPQRVCDVCGVRLQCIQPCLMNQLSRACQLPTQDLTDLSTLRSWLNFPWATTMEYEIYKAANSIYGYCKVGELKPEKSIPDSILRQAKGLAIVTEIKVGLMVTYKIGTGVVITRRADGSWSPPSAISTFGLGYGAQAGGELADYIIVLRNTEAIKTFCGNAHLSVGAGISASAGHLGRVAEADFRAGDGGYAACYTYSCSKGAFVGCAFNGSIVSTRTSINDRFYGGPIKASEILLGSLPRPPAAATLYKALSMLFDKIEKQSPYLSF